MKRFAIGLIMGAVALGMGSAQLAEAQIAGPKLALHVTGHATKGRCSTASPNGTNTACSSFVTQGNLLTSYDVYIVIANAPVGGTQGVTFGILYDGAAASGIGVFDWVGCGDLEFPGGGWPESGGGNVVTWATCQMEDIGGEGVQATVGSFYTYAYSNDFYQITRREYVPNPDLQWSSCASGTSDFDQLQTGIAYFGGATGCNPCLIECMPIATEKTTWGGIKNKLSGGE
ncbi:MAG: hypothetical protein HKN21_06330 [Candidatus Eisenbacteria bacterium]|uniref:PEP-CTERM sorting domain-containing protein n=1 Tax=Eiseniibacteriota bacterium TaxID=2212470 RepID=A0A7Y2EE69_UNCEI|nr:hypothetical protein [Candidatus Eisenbacteria bacterium]